MSCAPTIQCPDCLRDLSEAYPGENSFSRAFVSLEIHSRHQPMHPNQVGSRLRAEARREYATWKKLDPLAPTEGTK